jgi:hypothetical protein
MVLCIRQLRCSAKQTKKNFRNTKLLESTATATSTAHWYSIILYSFASNLLLTWDCVVKSMYVTRQQPSEIPAVVAAKLLLMKEMPKIHARDNEIVEVILWPLNCITCIRMLRWESCLCCATANCAELLPTQTCEIFFISNTTHSIPFFASCRLVVLRCPRNVDTVCTDKKTHFSQFRSAFHCSASQSHSQDRNKK